MPSLVLALLLLHLPVRPAPAAAATPDSVRLRPTPWLNANSDLGLLLGGGLRWSVTSAGDTAARHTMQLRAGIATLPRVGAIEFTGLWRPRRHGPVALALDARHSAIEVLNFYGFGTGAPRDRSRADAYYKAGQTHTVLAAGPVVRLGPRRSLAVSAVLKQVHTERDSTRFIFAEPRYGVQPHFDQAGARVALALDGQDQRAFPRRGLRGELAVSVTPALLDVRSAFGAVSAELSGAVTPPALGGITLASRVAGVRTWGAYPLHEAAVLGGATTLRSHRNGRFAGDASVIVSLDARRPVTQVTLRGELWDAGAYVLSDVGRVFFEGDTSARWHHGVGGGLWLAHPERRVVARVEVAAGDDGVAFRAGTGFRF